MRLASTGRDCARRGVRSPAPLVMRWNVEDGLAGNVDGGCGCGGRQRTDRRRVFRILHVCDDGPNEIAIPSGSALYLIGTFLVTMVCNVPLNNELASVESTGAAAAKTWARYVRSWTLWNHVRTGAALAASIALGLAAS